MNDRLHPLIVVAGPTGSGKSDAALRIAETFGGEIVNADSIQLYRGFDAGSAKVPLAERRGIRHHLIDIIDPHEICTAGDYSRQARAVIAEITSREKLPIVAGGTGFYVRALLEGLFAGPERNDELRAQLAVREKRRAGFLHRALRRFDPAAAQRIHPNDHNKLIRALEVCLLEKRPMTQMFVGGRDPLAGYFTLKLGLSPSREDLYRKLDARSEQMLGGGLVDEIRQLLASGVPPDAKPFESIGYKEALAFIRSELTYEQALELMRRDTRRYAKRQMTWFKRDKDITWVSGFGTDETTLCSILDIVKNHLHSVQK